MIFLLGVSHKTWIQTFPVRSEESLITINPLNPTIRFCCFVFWIYKTLAPMLLCCSFSFACPHSDDNMRQQMPESLLSTGGCVILLTGCVDGLTASLLCVSRVAIFAPNLRSLVGFSAKVSLRHSYCVSQPGTAVLWSSCCCCCCRAQSTHRFMDTSPLVMSLRVYSNTLNAPLSLNSSSGKSE